MASTMFAERNITVSRDLCGAFSGMRTPVNAESPSVFSSGAVGVWLAGTEQVKAALDVLDGKKPGLAEDAPLLKDIAKNALFASRGIDVPETYRKTTKCPVLQNCKAATVRRG